MCKFLEWYVFLHLRREGWPKQAGPLGRTYVDATVADHFIEIALMVLVALGAGCPDLATRILAMTSDGNPWTPESTEELFNGLRHSVDNHLAQDGTLPWRELANRIRIPAEDGRCSWDNYNSSPIVQARARASAQALYLGLTNPRCMPRAFNIWRTEIRRAQTRGAPGGVDTVSEFYAYAEAFVREFEKRETLPEIPRAVLARPEVADRLGQ